MIPVRDSLMETGTYRATGPGEEDQVDVDDLLGVGTGLLLEPTG